jgi:diadenosine tetraphosphate (Ap4A) HIT family hydrolase
MVKENQNQKNNGSKDDCIFCKIAKGEFDSAKVWEDENYLACLDIQPNTKGMTLVIPKKHFDSYAFDMPDKEYSNLLLAAKKVSKILEKGLGVKRVGLVIEGLGVNHVHIKLYPMHGLGEKFKEGGQEKISQFFDKYPGFLTTTIGPRVEIIELKKIAQEIINNSK